MPAYSSVQAGETARNAGFEPLEPYPGNNRTWWRCLHVECGNEVQLKLGGIVSGKNPCKNCNGQWVDPEKAAEVMRAAGLEPLEPYLSSKHRWRCKCFSCGEIVTPQYNSVLVQGSGCKFCGKNRGGEKRRVPERDAVELMRAAGYEPLEPYVNSQTHWKSTHLVCGREVAPTYGQIRGGNGGCKHCAGLYVDPEEAIEVMRAAGYEPLEPYVNSGHQWKCRCTTCGKETTPSYGEARIGSRCKFCANKAITPKDAVELMKRGGFEPLEPYPGSMNPWMCRHAECGQIMSPRYAHIQQGRRACQQCSKKYQTELLSLDPDEATQFMRLSGLEPLEPYPGSASAWRCIHIECGREVSPRYASIQQGQNGCRACAQIRVAQSLRTNEDTAVSLMKSAGFEPLEPYTGSSKKWTCRCMNCEQVISPTLSNVKNGHGCKFCAENGFAFDAPGIVYLLEHKKFAALKIGISTKKAQNDRVRNHERNGWSHLWSWRTPTGLDAVLVEEAILKWWRIELGAPAAMKKSDMPNGGYTETAPIVHVDVDETIQRINAILHQLGIST